MRFNVGAVLGLGLALVLVACAAGRFRFDKRAQAEDVEMRDLEDLLGEGDDVAVDRQQLERPPPEPPPPYRLGKRDVLNIYVMDHPEMSSQRVNLGELAGTTVQDDGMVHLPVLGAIEAEALTLEELRLRLVTEAAKYIVDPQVTVEMLTYASQRFFVLGRVRQPGVFASDGTTTLLDALALAGGAADDADLEGASVVRAGSLLAINVADVVHRGDLSRNVHLRAGDLIYVPDDTGQQVYVLGEVLRPGVVPMRHGQLSLAEALAATGGPTPARARRELAVLRGGHARPIVYTLELEEALLVDERVSLRPGDRVVVAPTGLSTASRYMQQLLPFLLAGQAAGIAAQGATNAANTATAVGNNGGGG